ncbi:MAG: hypothetical protein K6T77_06320 [candidate division WOR-3 bacterium]|jgi:hypothetical protein|nr:hypothetical protein [candidate division WOR-3 bacterium]MCR4424248.1 CRISPR-associated endonuclease Cas6 [candidate division WOR-3 bacterium]MDH7519334.1 CRISPR-associated endonuclease Cas6 [bacterium]
MEIAITKLAFVIDKVLDRSAAEKIRGYLGNMFWDRPELHHHRSDGSLVYRYPVVQYKIVDGECILIGFGEGTKILKEVFQELRVINLDGSWQEVISKSIETYSVQFGISSNPISYTFLTPWLALNEENYDKYQRLGSAKKRSELLSRVLVGNILSIAKSVGYTVKETIQADIKRIKETPTKLKGTPMLGFLGEFAVNFEIPDYLGLGKSVARGFGTVKKSL